MPSARSGVDLLSVRVDAWRARELIETALAWCEGGDPRIITYANVHVLNTACEQPALRRALAAADTVYCDGSGVRLASFILGSALPARLTAADWIEDFCVAAGRRGTRLFILAGAEGVAAKAAEVLSSRYPQLRIVGTHHGFVGDAAAAKAALERIDATKPELLLVGMGTPAQELWVTRHRERIGARVVWCVGALFDFVVGVQRRGPRWMLDNHLEWLARLASDPGRLWQRYLVGNPKFLARVIRQRVLGGRP